MSRLRNSPRVQRGAIITIGADSPIPTVISFQYNPDEMTRTLTPYTAGEGGARTEKQRIDRPPTEDITMKANFDATDGLEVKDPIAISMGIYPQLAALEMLLYPSKSRAIGNKILAGLGAIDIIPPMVPLTLLVWGVKRVVPIRIKNMVIVESAYDERLNPIRAEVSLSMTVLSYTEFCGDDLGGNIFLVHQGIKEAMGLIGTTASVVSFL